MYSKAQEASNLWEPDNKGQLQQNGASTTLLRQRLSTSQVPDFHNATNFYCGIDTFLCVLPVFMYKNV
jgi:hypothetical protein